MPLDRLRQKATGETPKLGRHRSELGFAYSVGCAIIQEISRGLWGHPSVGGILVVALVRSASHLTMRCTRRR